MKNDRKRLIVYLIALVAITSLFTTLYWNINVKPELEPGDRARFIPGGWTPELIQTYNESEPIKSLKYGSFGAIVINNEHKLIDEVVILMIPEGVESRALFRNRTYTQTWEDENTLIGNNTRSIETEIITAHVFVDLNVSNGLYDLCEDYNDQSITYNKIEIRGIDLTTTPFYNVEMT